MSPPDATFIVLAGWLGATAWLADGRHMSVNAYVMSRGSRPRSRPKTPKSLQGFQMLCLKAFQSTLHKIDDVRDLIDASSSREADMEKDDTELARERPSDAPRMPREIHIGELLGETKEAMIIHAGERYRLRITANNKLILTK